MSGRSARRGSLLQLGAIAAVIGFLVLVGRFWDPVYRFTALLEIGSASNVARTSAVRERPVFVQPDSAGYDGQYYAQLAVDPSLRDPELRTALDNPAYRARRILPSALAWVLALGRAGPAIDVYAGLNIAAWLAFALLLWRILPVRDARSWVAWAGVLFSAGALGSVRLALTDLIATLFVAAAIAAAETERKRSALVGVACGGLARETALLGAAGLIKPPWVSWKNAVRLLLVAIPLGAWLAYVRGRLGPADQGWDNLAAPLLGFAAKWRDTASALRGSRDPLLAWATLLATFSLCVQAVFLLARPEVADRWWRTGTAYIVLMLCLGHAVWEGLPGAATRVLLPLTLAFNVLAARRRAAWAWLVLGNLSFIAGLLAFRAVPSHPREIATLRRGSQACIAEIGHGWYETERARHVWNWTAREGAIGLQAWPRTTANLILQFDLRAMTPGEVRVVQDGHALARMNVGTAKASYSLPIVIRGGHATLLFTSGFPAVRENNTPVARELAFALYDLRVAVPPR
jgi:hypothetical protein